MIFWKTEMVDFLNLIKFYLLPQPLFLPPNYIFLMLKARYALFSFKETENSLYFTKHSNLNKSFLKNLHTNKFFLAPGTVVYFI